MTNKLCRKMYGLLSHQGNRNGKCFEMPTNSSLKGHHEENNNK